MADARLEADYDVLAGIGSTLPDIVAEWMQASHRALTAAEPEPLLVSYGTDDDLDYRVFRPRGRPRGAVLFLHGGFWIQGNKDSVLFPHKAFTRAGLCYVPITYGLAPRYTLDGLIANVEAATRSFAARAPELGVDPDRIVLAGHSAGAYLAAALAASERKPFVPLGLLLISGLFDLRPIHGLARIEKLALSADEADRLSIDGRDLPGRCKVILAIGEAEPAGFQRQTRRVARELAEAGAPPRIIAIPGCNHFSVARNLGNDGSILADAVARLFD